jgi:hypothetical protein
MVKILPHYLAGSDLTKRDSRTFVIDFFGLDEVSARRLYPEGLQIVIDRVKPERDHNRRDTRRRNWWLFGENAPKLRRAIKSLSRFIATSEVAKHRVFVFLPLPESLADGSLAAIALDDAFFLGVLSSRVHVVWALAAGGRMGMGNDPRYQNGPCFLPFPFPASSGTEQARIRDLGEHLDAHRKRQQAQHPELTITGMYNVLEKLRRGEGLDAKEKRIHEQGLVSTLTHIHDELDAAVFDAYGWPHDLDDEQILERLVALNAERAAEERRGLVRWLRPELQNPAGAGVAVQQGLSGVTDAETPEAAERKKVPPWPKALPARIAALRDLLLRGDESWALEDVAACFRNARRADVAAILDGLAALGLVFALDTAHGRRWKRAARTAA